MSFKSILTIFAMVVLLSFSAFNALAQGTTSRLTGTVTDSSGAAVEGAAVSLTNEGTGIVLTAQTSDSGSYTFDLIQAGNYQVSIEKQGFKKFVSNKNVVNINQPATVNVALEVGDISATVTVESVAENVQTSSSGNIGSTIEQKTLESLPIVGTRGRNPLELINFQPGVVSGANTGGGVHVNGARDRAFNFTLDGIDINDTTAGGSNFSPLRTNPDSIQEFQIVTSNFSAELGRSSGAQVTLITRAGTNRLTGNVFEYYQTPDFNANEFENNLNGVAKRQFVQHIFGGSIGGPIIKNKAFFFSNIQLLRAYETRLVTRTVLTDTARRGIFRYVANGRNGNAGTLVGSTQPSGAAVDAAGNPLYPTCPAVVPATGFCINSYNVVTNDPAGLGLDPSVQRVMQLVPSPNNFFVGDGLNTAGFNFAAPQREKQYDFTVRGDYNINDRNAIYVRYAQGSQTTVGDVANIGLQSFPGTPNQVDTFRIPKNLAINYRFSPTANITNEFIFGISRFSFSFNNPDENFADNPPFSFNLITNPLNNTPTVNNARRVRTNQFVDNLTYIRGAHTFKTGINFRFGRHLDDRQALTTLTASFGASFSANDLNDFRITGPNGLPGLNNSTTGGDRGRLQSFINDLLGRVGTISRSFVAEDDAQYRPVGEGLIFDARYPEYDFYFQDAWKVRSNLTVDLGLRWEPRPSPTSKGNPILRPEQPIRLGEAPSNTIRFVEGKLFDNDYNNFAPSVGFAYDPFKNGKTSIRANYRLAYDRLNTFVFSSSIFQTSPGLIFQATNPIGQSAGISGARLRNGLPLAPPPRTPLSLRQPDPFSLSGITVVDPDLQFPETHQWAISLQRDLGFGPVAEATYIGRRATHLFGGYDVNQVDITNNGFLNAFNVVRAGGDSPLFNQLFSADSRRTSTETGSQFARRQFTTELSSGAVGSVAAAIAQRSQGGVQLLTLSGVSPFFFRPFPQFAGSLNVLDSNDVSRYNGMELILKRRLNRGLGFQLGYTFSRSKDTRSFDPAFTTVGRGSGQSASSTPFDKNNRRLNYAPSDFDRRHVLQATYVYELPIGRGRPFGSDLPKALDLIIGGRQLAGTLNWTSGRPFTVYSGVNTFGNVIQSTANCGACNRSLGSLHQENGTTYFFDADDRSRFSVPNPGELGDTGRNFFIGPPQFQTDASLTKNFKLTERFNFDLRVDARNLTNTVSFGFPGAVFGLSSFGLIRDNTVSGSRRIQLSGKFNF